MAVSPARVILAAVALAVTGTTAQADDLADVARRYNLPIPVVDMVIRNVDAYFMSADAPSNRMTSGLIKQLGLKAVRSHIDSLEDGAPGKASESTAEEHDAVYKVTLRTTRHEASESAECVDASATLSSSEGVPVIRDGSFTFDSVHPRVSSYSWKLTFCRTPQNGGSDYTAWQLK